MPCSCRVGLMEHATKDTDCDDARRVRRGATRECVETTTHIPWAADGVAMVQSSLRVMSRLFQNALVSVRLVTRSDDGYVFAAESIIAAEFGRAVSPSE